MTTGRASRAPAPAPTPGEVVALRPPERPPAGRLPVELTSFVGREREVAEVVAALAGARILTLTGAGGCGKTRLALRAAGAAGARRPDGAWCVELAPIADPGLVAPALATALGVRPLPGRDDLAAAVAALASRRALVLLDNCEHLAEEAAGVAEALARGCPGVTVLATSREPLGAAGEVRWRVPSMTVPAAAEADSPAAALRSDAVRLFVERAGRARPGFVLTAAEAPAVVRICRELDGIPLAIELAAARMGALPAAAVADALADRFRLLTGGPRTALPRQRTLRASVDWSHDLLAEPERTLLRRLGVFAGGFAAATAERVCAGRGIEARDVLPLLTSLVDRSLIAAEERDGGLRFRLLETVRGYALERLAEAGEERWARERHLAAFLAVAEAALDELVTPRQPEVLDALDLEGANLAQALGFAAQTDAASALRLAIALGPWWRLRALFTQGDAAFRRILSAAPDGPEALRARALWGHAYLLAFSGDFGAAEALAHRALGEAERLGDEVTAARSLTILGKCDLMREAPPACRPALERAWSLALAHGDDLSLMHAGHALAFSHLFEDDHVAARRRFAEVLPVVERTGHREFIANHWGAEGWMRYLAGELPGAGEALARAVAAARAAGDAVTEAGVAAYSACARTDAGDPEGALEMLLPVHGRALAQGAGFLLPWAEVAIAEALAAAGRLDEARAAYERQLAGPAGDLRYPATWALAGLAETLRHLGDGAGAATAAERALESAEGLGNPWFAARARMTLGRLALARGDRAAAESLHHEALAALAERGFRLGLAAALEALAAVAVALESATEGARLLGAAGAIRRDLGLVPGRPEGAELDRLADRLREALGAEAVAVAREEGAALAPDEAVAWARRARGARRRPSSGWESLTPTERQTVRHVAAGLSNPEIGARMFVSRSTVKAHLAHVYAKLGVSGRAELIREAVRRDPAAPG
jgi:predicted ATPase/DNA-binding CsgD family transcriptional regulator